MRTLAAAAFLTVTAALAFAGPQDGKTYDLTKESRWQVGDLSTKTEDETQDEKVTVSGPDGTVVQEQAQKSKVHSVRVTKVLAADANGKPTRSLVFLKEWAREADGATDTCLAGSLYEVAKTDAGKEVTRKGGPEAPLSEEATSWVKKELGGSDDDKPNPFKPRGPLAVGQTWQIDLAEFAKRMGDGALPFDLTKGTGAGTLVSVAPVSGKPFANVEVAVSLPVTGMPGMPEGMAFTWKSGGMLKLSAKGAFSLDQRIQESSGKMEGGLEGDGEVGGMAIVLAIKFSGVNDERLGGEIPAALEAAAK